MSLTAKIKEASSKRFQASDGTFYAIQKVNPTEIIIKTGGIADLMKLQNGGTTDMEQLMKIDPVGAASAIKTALQMQPDIIRAGLIGEYDEQGNFKQYRYVDKPAIMLEDGEVNISFIPENLLKEILEAINALSPQQPKIEDGLVQTFLTQ